MIEEDKDQTKDVVDSILKMVIDLKVIPLSKVLPSLWNWTGNIVRKIFSNKASPKELQTIDSESVMVEEIPSSSVIVSQVQQPMTNAPLTTSISHVVGSLVTAGRGDCLDDVAKSLSVSNAPMSVVAQDKVIANEYKAVEDTSIKRFEPCEADTFFESFDLSVTALHHCLYGVLVCAMRCPANFKPFYRLAATAVELKMFQVN